MWYDIVYFYVLSSKPVGNLLMFTATKLNEKKQEMKLCEHVIASGRNSLLQYYLQWCRFAGAVEYALCVTCAGCVA